ncbi:hypothetical protein ACOSQ3_006352 [Xanthoceras sorbifolium]
MMNNQMCTKLGFRVIFEVCSSRFGSTCSEEFLEIYFSFCAKLVGRAKQIFNSSGCTGEAKKKPKSEGVCQVKS